jgi:NodT family efflux transporter outer membrane factor (OMF) lipoprotein
MSAHAPRIGLLALAAFAAVGAASCAVGPDYRRPTAANPDHFKETSPSTAAADPGGRWWLLFNDETLNGLESQVVISNQTLAESEAAWRAALAVVREQRAAFFPTVGLSGAADRSHSGGGGSSALTTSTGGAGAGTTTTTIASGASAINLFQLQASASWEIDLWGKLRRSLESARASADASEADLRAARLSTQGTLATTYLELREADFEEQLVAETVTAYARALEITKNRYTVGTAARSDVVQAETQLANAQATDQQLQLQRELYEHAIADLLGKAPAEFSLPPVKELLDSIPVVPAGVPSVLLKRRPDINAAERRVAAANATIGVQTAAYFPDLTLTGGYGFAATTVGTLFKAASRSWSGGASATDPLFDGGLRSGEVAAARAAYDQAVATYRQTVLDAFRAVEDGLVSSTLLAREFEARRRASTAADLAEQLALNQYKAGTISYTDVVVLQTAALSARQALAQARLACQTNAVSLVTALGGGWDEA